MSLVFGGSITYFFRCLTVNESDKVSGALEHLLVTTYTLPYSTSFINFTVALITQSGEIVDLQYQ